MKSNRSHGASAKTNKGLSPLFLAGQVRLETSRKVKLKNNDKREKVVEEEEEDRRLGRNGEKVKSKQQINCQQCSNGCDESF
ncbi:Cullin-1 [Trichinella spiralis]|uniref:Cullin-1 n=1 Tax=Trichinella spiralis TaxID=6334 RepID=A0ABR3K4A0_TRISP